MPAPVIIPKKLYYSRSFEKKRQIFKFKLLNVLDYLPRNQVYPISLQLTLFLETKQGVTLGFFWKRDDLPFSFFKFDKIIKFEKKLKGTPLVFIHEM